MLSVHQQEGGRDPLIVACVLLSLDEGLISLGRFCLLESPFLFCSPRVHLSSFVVLPGSMPPVFPTPLDGLTYYLATTFFLSIRMCLSTSVTLDVRSELIDC